MDATMSPIGVTSSHGTLRESSSPVALACQHAISEANDSAVSLSFNCRLEPSNHNTRDLGKDWSRTVNIY